MHSITSRRDFNHIPGFCSFWVWSPKVVGFTLAILAGLCLGSFWVLERVVAIGNSHIIHIKGEFLVFSKVENTLMGATPIGAEVGLVFIMPYDPPTPLKKT